MRLRLAYLYPDLMNIYGDRGNVIALQQRCGWRGIQTELVEVGLNQSVDWRRIDLVFGGGGQDQGQVIVSKDLMGHGHDLNLAMMRGMPMLLVCGLYQLFGRRFVTAEGAELMGIGLFDAETLAGPRRLIGNIVIDSEFGRLVGFENHSGQTKLMSGQALGRVVHGFGNDGSSGLEGVRVHNAIGTYLHGPVLPKNPALADFLIESAISQHQPGYKLAPLDDRLEERAAGVASQLHQ